MLPVDMSPVLRPPVKPLSGRSFSAARVNDLQAGSPRAGNAGVTPISTGTDRFVRFGGYASAKELQTFLDEVKYKDRFYFVAYGETPNDLEVQVQYDAPDIDVPGSAPERRTGARRWKLTPDPVQGQILNTLKMALMFVEEHELREHFFFKGVRPFNPHFDYGAFERFIEARKKQGGLLNLPEPLLSKRRQVQKVLDQCSIGGYRFKLVSLYKESDSFLKKKLVVQVVSDPDSPPEDNPLFVDMPDKKVTFATTMTEGRIAENLLTALINEANEEIKWRLEYRGDVPFRQALSIEDKIEFLRQLRTK